MRNILQRTFLYIKPEFQQQYIKKSTTQIVPINNNLFSNIKPTQYFHSKRCYSNVQSSFNKRPVVIGGSNVDIVVSTSEDIIMDGRMLNGNISQCCGGVGRNIADALSRLNMNPLFITAIGNDEMGNILLNGMKHINNNGINIIKNNKQQSACVFVMLDNDKECKLLIGNMNMHKEISLELIKKYETEIINSNFVILDGNLSIKSIEYIILLCKNEQIPIWYEPTDIAICDIILKCKNWEYITYMSPNFNELKKLASILDNKDYSNIKPNNLNEFIKYSIKLSKNINNTNLMVTLGKYGMIMISKDGTNIQYYKALKIDSIENVSGAGDCAVAGYIAAHLKNMNELEKVGYGLFCARQSLKSSTPVPEQLKFDFNMKEVETEVIQETS